MAKNESVRRIRFIQTPRALGDAGRTLAVGITASGAVNIAMWAARRLGATDLHFPRALGALFTAKRRRSRALGWLAFLGTGVALATGYRLVLSLVPPARRTFAGAVIGLVHGVVAATGGFALAPLHPRPRRAGMRRRERLSPPTLAVICGVHVLYGSVVGRMLEARGPGARSRRSREPEASSGFSRGHQQPSHDAPPASI